MANDSDTNVKVSDMKPGEVTLPENRPARDEEHDKKYGGNDRQVYHYSQLQPAAGVVAKDVAGTVFDRASDSVSVEDAVGGSGPRTDKAHTNQAKVKYLQEREQRRAEKRAKQAGSSDDDSKASSSSGSSTASKSSSRGSK